MGTPAEVRAKIDAHLPGVEWSDDYGGFYSGDDFTFEIDVGGQSQLGGFLVVIRGSGDAVSALLRFATPNGWSLFDTISKILHPTPTESAISETGDMGIATPYFDSRTLIGCPQ